MSIQRVVLCLVVGLPAMLGGIPPTTMPRVPAAAMALSAPAPTADTDDTLLANEYLVDLKAQYRYLEGVTVHLGTTPHGEEAVAFYTKDEIVVSRTHTYGITTILDHEIWHIIDWRDNGRLDWGEALPPSNADAYASR